MRLWFTLLSLIAGIAAHAAVPPGLSGSWYDPAHAGHGLSIQVLGDGRAIAYWFAYDPGGDPIHLYIDGKIDDRTIRGTAYAARGMRFGSFDAAALQVPRWGEVEIAFADCGTAMLEYDANGEAGAGYGAGTLPLARLSSIGGVSCSNENLSPLAPGLAGGAYLLPNSAAGDPGAAIFGAIDTDGLIWAFRGPVLVPARSTRGGIRPEATNRILPNGAFFPNVIAPNAARLGEIRTAFATSLDATGVSTGGTERGLASWRFGRAFDSSAVEGRLDPVSLTGSKYFNAIFTSLHTAVVIAVEFDADGSLRISLAGDIPEQPLMTGRFSVRSTTHRFFDFEVFQPSSGRTYRGRGWVFEMREGVPTRIALVGASQDDVGVGLRLERQP